MYLKPGMIAFLVACNCGKKEEDTAVSEPVPVEDSASSEDTAEDTAEEVLEETGADTGSDTAEEE